MSDDPQPRPPAKAPPTTCPHCGGELKLHPATAARARAFGLTTTLTHCCDGTVAVRPYVGLEVLPLTPEGEYLEQPEDAPGHPASAFRQVGTFLELLAKAWPKVVREHFEMGQLLQSIRDRHELETEKDDRS